MLWRSALLWLVRAWRGSFALAGCSGGMFKTSKKIGRSQQEASKRPARTNSKPAGRQQEASKRPARGQQEARKRPARSQQEARKMPQMGGTPRNTETIEKQLFS